MYVVQSAKNANKKLDLLSTEASHGGVTLEDKVWMYKGHKVKKANGKLSLLSTGDSHRGVTPRREVCKYTIMQKVKKKLGLLSAE